jgi:undecaprenyl-diphosphatase
MQLPLWLVIVILGAVEGITEFIPVSSTGHLLIAEQLLRSKQSDLFNIIIQSAAVLAVIPLFRPRWEQFLFRWRERSVQDYALKLALAFGITGVGGLAVDKAGLKLPENPLPVMLALFIGGVAFLVIERWLKGRTEKDELSWAMAAGVGAAQIVAMVFPGTSRSGASILLLLALGLGRPAATEFSFLVGIPTMIAAGGLKVFKALHHGAPAENWGMVALGCVISAVVSFIAVKWLLRFVQTHTFVAFGWYRIAFAGVLLVLCLA